MEPVHQDTLIGARVGHYEIERLLGVGGMAHVYLARDTLLGREVAIKALAPTCLTNAVAVAQFHREAQRVAALDHPNIAPVLHMIEHDRRLYLVMPLFVEALRERLQRAPRLEVNEAVGIVSDVGSALAAAHAQGLVHRDVKPGNILLDQHGRAFLCDFGIACHAKATDDAETLILAKSGLPVGTPLYMAPEQIRGEELDHRADIYALGAVLYQALTGRTPHKGDTLLALATSALTDPITPPSILNPAVARPVERVILRALSRRPEDRYANVTAFVKALQAAAAKATDAATDVASHPALALPWRSMRGAVQPLSLRGGKAGVAFSALVLSLALAGGLAFANVTGTAQSTGLATHVSESGYQRQDIPAATASPTTTTATTKTTPATPAPTPKATATPAPQHTAPSSPPLSVSALRLIEGHGNQCSGVQTIANSGAQRITWQWEATSPAPHPSLAYGINAPAQMKGLPADRSPGVAPGGADILNVSMKCAGQSYTVTLRDSLGRTQQFTITSDSSKDSDNSDNSDNSD